jgi:hypothetical protein
MKEARAQAAKVLKINPKSPWRISLKTVISIFKRLTKNALSTPCKRLV